MQIFFSYRFIIDIFSLYICNVCIMNLRKDSHKIIDYEHLYFNKKILKHENPSEY